MLVPRRAETARESSEWQVSKGVGEPRGIIQNRGQGRRARTCQAMDAKPFEKTDLGQGYRAEVGLGAHKYDGDLPAELTAQQAAPPPRIRPHVFLFNLLVHAHTGGSS